MFTAKMKQELIEKIQSLNDDNTLEEVYRILEAGSQEIEMAVLTKEQENLINIGLKDIEEGRFISNDQAKQEAEEWLKK